MSDFDTTNQSVEARLHDYGDVLRAHLAGEADTDTRTGTVLLGGFGTAQAAPKAPSRSKRYGAILTMAAALLVIAGLMVPTLFADDGTEPITVTGGDTATQPETNDPSNGVDPAVDADEHDEDGEPGDEVLNEDRSGRIADEQSAGEDPDWSAFAVRISGIDAIQADERGDHKNGDSATDGADEDDHDDGNHDADGDTKQHDADSTTDGDTQHRADGDSAGCPTGAVKRSGECVTIGAPPTQHSDGCPEGAVEFGSQCYEVVPPSCGDLAVAPGGDGCLKLVGSAAAQGACPTGYELNGGDTCVKHLPANASCAQGTPVGDQCLIEKAPTDAGAGCPAGTLQIGNQCYELSAATRDCGGLTSLGGGMCRLPVSGEHGTQCPAGLEPWDDICYRYLEGDFSCPQGVLDGGRWCKITETATPGPVECHSGSLQDESGCYVLWPIHGDGTCGGLPEFEGQCREAKESWPTWTCADGSVVYESDACFGWVDAVISCAQGVPYDGNTRCKIIEDPITTNGCPTDALEDSQGCYKAKEPSVHCGELALAPDGENCKRWVTEAAAGSQCPAGFELVGGSTCKKYLAATSHSCAGAELVTVGGEPTCRYTKAADGSAGGCTAGSVEKDGNCYITVEPSCGLLDADIYGSGCKKVIPPKADDLTCQAGYTLAGSECIKKL